MEVSTVTERAAATQATVINASGYVTARRRATVSSKVTGELIEVNVEEGMAVREGQVLARLDDSTVTASLALGAARSSPTRRPRDRSFNTFRDALTSNPQVNVQVRRETEYYAQQSRTLSSLIQGVGFGVAALMGVGAVFAAI